MPAGVKPPADAKDGSDIKMPLYEFHCGKCEENFEKFFAVRADYVEGSVACPACLECAKVKRVFSPVSQAKFILSKTKKLNLIDLGYKMSKGKTPPGLKRLG